VHVPSRIVESLPTPTPNHAPIGTSIPPPPTTGATAGEWSSPGAAIVEYRDAHGPFATVDALDAVPGLGPAKIEAIRGQVIID